MNRLGESRLGRCVLHLLAMAGDREFTFHWHGILREART